MFVLGSSSKPRLEILSRIGFIPKFQEAPEIDETKQKGESPKQLSLRLAKEKGLKLALKYNSEIILSADTVVCVGRRIIEKCETETEVEKAIKMLSGKNHRVFTTVCLTKNDKQIFKTVETRIKFKHLTSEEIKIYVKSNEGLGKAGGYTINGIAESFIIQIVGSVSAVIGLPSYQTKNLLLSFGIKPSHIIR